MTRNTYARAAAVILALTLSLCLSGCGGKKVDVSPDVASSDEALFRLGETAIKKDMDKALLYLRQLIDTFPKSFYAQRAKLLIADAYFKKGDEANMILAAAEYREFISLYPYSPSAAHCQYQIAMSSYAKALKPGRDQSKTLQALAEFKKCVSAYPLSEEAKLAQDRIKDCEQRLAEHALTIAKHYHRVRAYKAAISRLKELLDNYPSYTKMDQVFFYLGDSYFLWNKPEEAVPFFTKLVTDYPKSETVKMSQARLAEIETKAKAKK